MAEATPRNRGILQLPWLGALPVLFLVLVMLAPVWRLGLEARSGATLGMVADLWRDDYLRWRVVWSFLQAGVTCVAALVLALPVSWVLARFQFPGRALVLRLLMLPFVVPTLVAAMGVLALWGPRGWISAWAGFDLQDTPWLLLYGNLFFNLCLVVRAGVDALGQVSAARVAAARTLGATPWRVFWRVEWPAIVPWLASSLCLVFLYCFSGFGLALVLGGQRYATVEVEIYTLVAHELKLAQAGVLALCMALLTGCVALAYAWIEQRLSTPGRSDVIALRRPGGAKAWCGVVAAMLVLMVFCAAPLLAIGARALTAGRDAWAGVLDAESLRAIWNTVRFTAVALLLATALGVAHALAARRSVWMRAAAFLPFVISPVTVAFGLLLLYPRLSASMLMLVAAYALLAYPFVAKSLGAALDNLPAHLTQAARTLGATPWRLFWRVTLPLVAPSLRRGMAFAAATALGEFAVTLFLSRPEWTTLTTLIYERLGRPGAANQDAALVLATVLMLLALMAFLLIEKPVPTDRHAGRPHAGDRHA
jgi:thiamine transport system permease protein